MANVNSAQFFIGSAKASITATNVGAGAGWTNIPVNALLATPPDTIGLTVNGGNQLVVPTGVYMYLVNFEMTSNVQRVSAELSLLLNGATIEARFGSTYIRAASGNNEAGETYSGLIEVTAPSSTLNLRTRRHSGTGGGPYTVTARTTIGLVKIS